MKNGWFSKTATKSEPSTLSRKAEAEDATKEFGHDQIDSYIANALTQLSTQERDKVYHQLHGVDDVIEETPEFVSQKLQVFDTELGKVRVRHKKGEAIQLAQSMDPEYVSDPGLRLKFLRADSFNVEKAVDRMVRFFDIKLYLFGKDKLCLDITMKELSPADRATLKAGFMQLLPVRDRAGRAVFMLLPSFQTYEEPENMTRAMFYIVMSGLDDLETQRKGYTILIYNVGAFVDGKTDLKTVTQGCWVQATLPFKTCSLHHCFNDEAFRVIVNISMMFFGEAARARAKMHYGAHVECLYALMTFGIPVASLPVTIDGELKRKNHLEWIKMRKRQEVDISDESRIVVPAHADVLFGRGKPFREHIGNMRLFNLLDANLMRYEVVTTKGKSGVIAEMVELTKAEHGRFLKQQGCTWVEVDDKMAREKVSHAFRTRLRISASNGETNTNDGNNTQKPTLIRPDNQSSRKSPVLIDSVETKRARTMSP